jgi:hypothetical protein
MLADINRKIIGEYVTDASGDFSIMLSPDKYLIILQKNKNSICKNIDLANTKGNLYKTFILGKEEKKFFGLNQSAIISVLSLLVGYIISYFINLRKKVRSKQMVLRHIVKPIRQKVKVVDNYLNENPSQPVYYEKYPGEAIKINNTLIDETIYIKTYLKHIQDNYGALFATTVPNQYILIINIEQELHKLYSLLKDVKDLYLINKNKEEKIRAIVKKINDRTNLKRKIFFSAKKKKE